MLDSGFRFYAPATAEEAIGILADAGEGGKLLAGGMSLMPMINLGLAHPGAIVSMNHIAGLEGVQIEDGVLHIGARVSHARIESDDLIGTHCPALSSAAGAIGDVQVRHRGTIGGSLAHADPSADYMSVLCAVGGSVVMKGRTGTRRVAMKEFVRGFMTTACREDELIVEVEVPAPHNRSRQSAYVRLARVEGSFAIVNASAFIDGDVGTVAVGGVGSSPLVVARARDRAGGWRAFPRSVAEVVRDAVEVEVQADDSEGEGYREYRRAMAVVYARRAVSEALKGLDDD